MAKITKVPDGPLVKKKGPFKGSTLKAGGKIKKAVNGTTTTQTTTPPVKKSWNQMSVAERIAKRDNLNAKGRGVFSKYMDSTLTADFAKGAERRGITVEEYAKKVKNDDKVKFTEVSGGCGFGNDKPGCSGSEGANRRRLKREANRKNGGPIKKAKSGAMIKRADGSMSKRGLWDNLRSKAAQNKKTGAKPKAPSKAMLTQEKKIKAKGK